MFLPRGQTFTKEYTEMNRELRELLDELNTFNLAIAEARTHLISLFATKSFVKFQIERYFKKLEEKIDDVPVCMDESKWTKLNDISKN